MNRVARTRVIKGEVPAGRFEPDESKDVVFEEARAQDVDCSDLVCATFTAEQSEFDDATSGRRRSATDRSASAGASFATAASTNPIFKASTTAKRGSNGAHSTARGSRSG